MVWSNLRDENMRNSYLRWFVHVKRKVINATVRKKKVVFIQVERTKRDRLFGKLFHIFCSFNNKQNWD